MKRITKAVIPAGGRGTRFLPITRACAKELLPIIDRPVTDYIIDEILDSGLCEILIIISGEKENIKRYYQSQEELEKALVKSGNQVELDRVRRRMEAKISFVLQQSAGGSGEAMLLAEEFASGEAFAVLLGDDVVYNPPSPATAQLVRAHGSTGGTIVGVQQCLTDEIYKYGVVKVEGEGRLQKMQAILEKPKKGSPIPSRLCALGRYVFTSEIFDAIKNTQRAANGELQLTDSINLLCGGGGVYAYDFEGIRYDLGDKLGALTASVEYGLRREDIGAEFKSYLKKLAKEL